LSIPPALLGCSKEPPAGQGTQTSAQTPAPQGAATVAVSESTTAAPAVVEGAGARAEVGKPAPDFTLKDLDGKDVALSSFKGKVVVLEWFNPGCPFVQKSHTKGSPG